jgi:hypothetical protein
VKNINALYSIIKSKPISMWVHIVFVYSPTAYPLTQRWVAICMQLDSKLRSFVYCPHFFLKVEEKGCSIYLCNEIYIWTHISLCLKARGLVPPPKGCSLSILACCLFGKRARALQMQVVSFTQKTIMLPESINVTFRNSALVLRIRHSD